MRFSRAAAYWARRATSTEGATAVEYAIMVALVAIVIVGAVIAIGIATSDALCGPVPTLGGGAGDC
jgi:pilus assembly protein Flp/PilA